MKKLKWWFIIVGAFYLLLALMNMYFVLINPSAMASMTAFPFPVTADTIRAFVDGWSPFAFEILGIATFMLWASRNPRRYLGAAWLLVWLELLARRCGRHLPDCQRLRRGGLHRLHRYSHRDHRHRRADRPRR